MRRLLKEPLLHFLLMGAVIFAANGWVSKPGSQPGQIVITQGEVASIVEGFVRTWQRPPTGDELSGLVRDRVREEVYYREALALGLDKDDLIIRRRLQQKMEFVTDDVVAQAQPTDDELRAYLKAHPDLFRVEPQFTFAQVFLNPEKHGDHLATDAAQLLARLGKAGGAADISTLGDSIMLDGKFDKLRAGEVTKLFGEGFTAALDAVLPGRWQGPVESAYGAHLVYVSARTHARVPELSEVRDAVHREWANGKRLQANDKFYEDMLSRYTVTIERPESEEEKRLAAAK